PGGVFVRRADQLAADELLMLQATARVHVNCDGRSLARIVEAATGRVRPGLSEGENGVSVSSDVGGKGEASEAPSRRSRRGGEERRPTDDGRLVAGASVGPAARTGASAAPASPEPEQPPRPALHLDNSIGGFTDAGDYEM